MTAEQIIDHIRANPGHPPTISTAEWAAVVQEFDRIKLESAAFRASLGPTLEVAEERGAEIQRLQSQIAQLLDEKKQTDGR